MLLLAAPLVGCGSESERVATFTSDVVQRESCRVHDGGDAESCTRDEQTLRLRVTLVEDALDRALLFGIPRAGGSDRAIVGTVDSQGGYLFTDERVQRNARTGCALTERVELSLRVDEEAAVEDVGVNDCVALVGREVRRTLTSAECDEVNDPPRATERIVRRRWQPAVDCE